MGGLSSSPITTMNSNSIANSKTNTVSKKTDIKIDNITVETQATDAQGIAQEITGQISSVYHHNNDGMDA